MHNPKKIFQVALLVDTATSWSRSLIAGILKYTKENGPWHIHLEPQPANNQLHLPKNWHGDGIIARIATEKLGEQLDATGAKIVNISSIRLENDHWPRVITSAKSEAKLAFETLRSRGFRQFAYAGDVQLLHVAGLYHAFEKVLGEAGYTTHISPSLAPEKLEKWLKSLPKPIAIYCWGPSLGHELIDICRNAGIKVPYDVAVLGSNYDELLSESSYPPQAGIRMATEQIGVTAASILDGMMHGKNPKKMQWNLEPLGVVEKLSIDTLAVEDRRMADVMRFLNAHALEPISVPDVLKANPMARRSLERKFHQLFGCSVIEQIHRLRVNHARMLLADTDDPVTLIAEKCCFSCHNYLNRIFKQSTGLSPSQYRSQFRKVKV
jgi:LacI family transcriptional regulator